MSENKVPTSAVQDVPDGPVGAPPHLLQLELLDAALVGCDRCALDRHIVPGKPSAKELLSSTTSSASQQLLQLCDVLATAFITPWGG